LTQICSNCGIEKPLAAFPSRKDRPSGRGTICLECGRAYRKRHYAENRDYYLTKASKARQEVDARHLRLLVDYLTGHPCVDCGETDVRVLQFDHIDPELKNAAVSLLLRRRVDWTTIRAEIDKCQVRCGNCHRRRTIAQKRSGEIREESVGYVVYPEYNRQRAVSSADRAAHF
jgi:hypothetical protein